MGPFLAFGLATALMGAAFSLLPSEWARKVGFGLLVAGYLIPLAGLGVGWVKRFPRWSYPYVTLVVLFTLYWMSVATPGVRIFNYTFGSQDLWGWRAWIPFLVMAAVAILVTRSVRPVVQLVTGVRHDWTRLSFGLYGLMPLVVWISFDEVNMMYQLPYLIASTIALAGGALAYGRSARTWQRALSLLAGLTLAWAVTTVGVATYWHGRQEYWMPQPGNGYEDAQRAALGWVVLVAVTFAPVLLGHLRRAITSIRRYAA
jgi:hypothetical protein